MTKLFYGPQSGKLRALYRFGGYGVKMKTERIRKVAEVIADELLQAEVEIKTEVETQTDLYWAAFLKSQGLGHIWRKGLLTKHILIEDAV